MSANHSKLEDAIANFHSDWGGDGSAMEVADELRKRHTSVERFVSSCPKDSQMSDEEIQAEVNAARTSHQQDFYANVDEALEQAKQGRVHRMLPNESLDDFLKRVS